MFFKCTSCQAITEPPLPPAQSSNLTHCPKCGSTVTMIHHDTERPPALDAEPVHVTSMGTVATFCATCGGRHIVDAESARVTRIDHAPGCVELDAEADDDDGFGDRLPRMDREVVE